MGHQSMNTCSPGREPQQSFILGSSQRSSNASTSLRTGQLTPPMWSGRSSSLLDAQTSYQTNGSTLSRGCSQPFQWSSKHTIPPMSRPSSPKTLGTCSISPIWVPKQSKANRTYGDWVIAFGKTIQVITFALPGQYAEYITYQVYMSALFTSVSPSFHFWVIDLDKAIRFWAANQKHLCLSELAQFDDLRTIYLTSFGVGSGATDRSQGGSRWGAGLPRSATTGIKVPVTNRHQSVLTSMSPITVGVGEPTDIQSVQSQSINQELSRGHKFSIHFV